MESKRDCGHHAHVAISVHKDVTQRLDCLGLATDARITGANPLAGMQGKMLETTTFGEKDATLRGKTVLTGLRAQCATQRRTAPAARCTRWCSCSPARAARCLRCPAASRWRRVCRSPSTRASTHYWLPPGPLYSGVMRGPQQAATEARRQPVRSWWWRGVPCCLKFWGAQCCTGGG